MKPQLTNHIATIDRDPDAWGVTFPRNADVIASAIREELTARGMEEIPWTGSNGTMFISKGRDPHDEDLREINWFVLWSICPTTREFRAALVRHLDNLA